MDLGIRPIHQLAIHPDLLDLGDGAPGAPPRDGTRPASGRHKDTDRRALLRGIREVVGAPDAGEPGLEDTVEVPEPLGRPRLGLLDGVGEELGRNVPGPGEDTGLDLAEVPIHRELALLPYRSGAGGHGRRGRPSRHPARGRGGSPDRPVGPSPRSWPSRWSPISCQGPSLNPMLIRRTPCGRTTRTSSVNASCQRGMRWSTWRASAAPKTWSANGSRVASPMTRGKGGRPPAFSTSFREHRRRQVDPEQPDPGALEREPDQPGPDPDLEARLTGVQLGAEELGGRRARLRGQSPGLVVHLGGPVERDRPSRAHDTGTCFAGSKNGSAAHDRPTGTGRRAHLERGPLLHVREGTHA